MKNYCSLLTKAFNNINRYNNTERRSFKKFIHKEKTSRQEKPITSIRCITTLRNEQSS